MRILFLDQFNALGGGQQCLADLIRGFSRRGWQAHVGLPGRGPLTRILRETGAQVHAIPLSNYSNGYKSAGDLVQFAIDVPRVAFAVHRLVRAHSIDLVYANGPRVLPAAALASRRVVFHLHSLPRQGYTATLVAHSLRARSIPVIASSRFVAQPLLERLPQNQIRVVYNGVPDYGPSTRPPTGNWRIGIIGRVAPEKGHLDFVRMARELTTAGCPCQFVICGDGQHSGDAFLREVRALATGLPVKFVPWQSDIRSVLGALDLLVVPSRPVDATPRVIPEAMSAGIPVIAYRTGGIPELLGDGEGGVLVQPGDAGALAREVGQLLADPERVSRISGRARRSYQRRFTLDRYVQEIATVLESELPRLASNRRIDSAADSAISPATARTMR